LPLGGYRRRRTGMADQCVLVSTGTPELGRTGVTYAAGVSEASAGASGLCLQLASLPPAARGRAHKHERHESAAYVLEGEMVLWSGARLEHRLVAGQGDFVYIPADVPHLVANASDSAPALAVLSRNDGREQEDVTELPDLDALPHLRP